MPALSGTQARRTWRMRWSIAAVWWTVDGLITATNYHRMGVSPGDGRTREVAVLATLYSAWLWIPFTVLAFWLAARFPLERGVWRRYLPLHVAAALGVCLLRALAVIALNPWAAWYAELPPLREVLLTSVANNLFLFWMLVGVGHALLFAERSREREEQLVRAELQALKLQLHPHFLFNALNAVSAYVRPDPDTAERLIGRLSQLLRHALDASGTDEVTLAEELRILTAYLDIEMVRFEDRLHVEWQIDPETCGFRVPHLLLQPLVENAIRHGIAPRAAEGTVTIVAQRRDGSLHLAVRDDGVGLLGRPPHAAGVGLANTRSRLRCLYGAEQQMDVIAPPGGGVHVELRLPLRAGPALARG
jgi:signal transduction histidine kinase